MNPPIYGSSTCTPPYYRTSGPGHTKDCRRIEVAQKAIRKLLNADTTDSAINTNDETALGVKFGFMKFSYGPTLVKSIGTPYSQIWNAVNASFPGGGRLW